jgi:hypothetical protein
MERLRRRVGRGLLGGYQTGSKVRLFVRIEAARLESDDISGLVQKFTEMGAKRYGRRRCVRATTSSRTHTSPARLLAVDAYDGTRLRNGARFLAVPAMKMPAILAGIVEVDRRRVRVGCFRTEGCPARDRSRPLTSFSTRDAYSISLAVGRRAGRRRADAESIARSSSNDAHPPSRLSNMRHDFYAGPLTALDHMPYGHPSSIVDPNCVA